MSVLWQSFYGGGVSIVNAILPNNTYLKGRNTAGTPLNLIGVDLVNRIVVGGNAATFAGTNLTTQTIVMPDTLVLSAPNTVSALLQVQTASSPGIQFGVAGAANSIATGTLTGDLGIRAGSGLFPANALFSMDGGATISLKLTSAFNAVFPGKVGIGAASIPNQAIDIVKDGGGNFLQISMLNTGVAAGDSVGMAFTTQGSRVFSHGLVRATGTYVFQSNALTPVGGAGSVAIDALTGLLTLGTAQLLATSISLTNNAAAQAATLLNSPTAGNPTKWFPINDNGTTRNIPAW